jgi:hypothetical protein
MSPVDETLLGSLSAENPVYRERRALHLTPKVLGERAGVPLQTVYDVEKGVLANVPVNISVFFGKSPGVFNREYNEWKSRCRSVVTLVCPDIPFIAKVIQEGVEEDFHPLVSWYGAMGLSLSTFTSMVRVQRRAVINYIKGLQKTLPQEIQGALLECSWAGEPDDPEDKSRFRRRALDNLIRLGNDFHEGKSRERLEQSRVSRELERRGRSSG